MSLPLEQGYAALSSELPTMEKTSENFSHTTKTTGTSGLNLKATELRLGLPGYESPDRNENNVVYPLSMHNKCLVSGAKRGFSDAIDGGSGNWLLSGNDGSEVGLSKDANLFSPRGVTAAKALVGAECINQQKVSVLKDKVHSPKQLNEKKPQISASPAKEQVVGWPPIRSFRKNSMATHPQKNDDDDTESKSGCLYVKISMDGAPYLRKVDLKIFSTYRELSSALEKMFSCFTISQCGSHKFSESRLMDLLHGSEYVLTYEDKDGDWMLVGDVPWEMFTDSCKRLRIMKSSEAIGLAPRAMEKSKSRN
ncbi:putative transcription factor interactor and regulator AUX-IAA family [Lupinus albus]|uniref:Auxin-induced protein n=1 Tax=Lupinus albus TaxID=3870 RepID=A0A6A4PFP0_LUPAL|nr:putative transcription factor interactor and regulator AUX-IAA family [Lupinus albus]